jgi:hypothetical protein
MEPQIQRVEQRALQIERMPLSITEIAIRSLGRRGKRYRMKNAMYSLPELECRASVIGFQRNVTLAFD